jgi:hypothetical protein
VPEGRGGVEGKSSGKRVNGCWKCVKGDWKRAGSRRRLGGEEIGWRDMVADAHI